VLLSHDQHADNLDTAGRSLLAGAAVTITTQAGAHRLGTGARGLAPWSSTTLQAPGRTPIEITATPCRHGPPGSHLIVGDVIGFALTWDGQEHGSLWISGDSVLYDGLREVAARLRVGTAMVHMGGVRFPVSGPLRYTMNAREAAELCELLDPRTIVPVHCEGWKHFREPLGHAARILGAGALAERVVWPEPGVPLEVAV
jgi:L-ascorbate metabolism protein UlaG (beta-lactamase superfamily)